MSYFFCKYCVPILKFYVLFIMVTFHTLLRFLISIKFTLFCSCIFIPENVCYINHPCYHLDLVLLALHLETYEPNLQIFLRCNKFPHPRFFPPSCGLSSRRNQSPIQMKKITSFLISAILTRRACL